MGDAGKQFRSDCFSMIPRFRGNEMVDPIFSNNFIFTVAQHLATFIIDQDGFSLLIGGYDDDRCDVEILLCLISFISESSLNLFSRGNITTDASIPDDLVFIIMNRNRGDFKNHHGPILIHGLIDKVSDFPFRRQSIENHIVLIFSFMLMECRFDVFIYDFFTCIPQYFFDYGV